MRFQKSDFKSAAGPGGILPISLCLNISGSVSLMGVPPRAQHARTPPPPRWACARCLKSHNRCERANTQEPCARCARLKLPCVAGPASQQGKRNATTGLALTMPEVKRVAQKVPELIVINPDADTVSSRVLLPLLWSMIRATPTATMEIVMPVAHGHPCRIWNACTICFATAPYSGAGRDFS